MIWKVFENKRITTDKKMIWDQAPLNGIHAKITDAGNTTHNATAITRVAGAKFKAWLSVNISFT
jgi:hypothetical protein